MLHKNHFLTTLARDTNKKCDFLFLLLKRWRAEFAVYFQTLLALDKQSIVYHGKIGHYGGAQC